MPGSSPFSHYFLLEELVALVLDVGTHTVRLGYSGDDTPGVLSPSMYGRCSDGRLVFGEGALSVPRQGMEVLPLFSCTDGSANGNLTMTKDAMIGFLKWAIEDRLQTKGSAHPILLVDSPWWGKDLREALITLLFEDLDAPAVFLGRSPVLAAFSSGKHTGLVVDIGHAGISVTPVFDGYVVKTAGGNQRALGGEALNSACYSMLAENGLVEPALGTLAIEVTGKAAVPLAAPPQFVRKELPAISPSFRAYQERRVLEDFKESVLQVSEASLAAETDLAMRPPKYYEFPSGFNRNFGFDRFRLGEILFQPNKYAYAAVDASGDQIMGSESQQVPTLGLADMIQRAIQSCDVDLRPSVVAAVQLCGGGASIPGLSERLNADLNRMPTFGRVRVQMATSTNERRNASWIGGSILASLNGFHQLWLTRQEFQEHGASYIERKSP